MKSQYKTVSIEAHVEFEEKKSKFIAHVLPAKTEEEAVGFINFQKSKYWDATHNVYAYVIGENSIQRYSDDGEPSGTAGIPVLEVIKKRGLQDVVVVVTRYFGGIMLGAGGLVRAYGTSASQGIEGAIPITREQCVEMVVTVEYSLLGKIQNFITANSYILGDIKYLQDVEIKIYIKKGQEEEFHSKIIEETNANCLIEHGNSLYITI